MSEFGLHLETESVKQTKRKVSKANNNNTFPHFKELNLCGRKKLYESKQN